MNRRRFRPLRAGAAVFRKGTAFAILFCPWQAAGGPLRGPAASAPSRAFLRSKNLKVNWPLGQERAAWAAAKGQFTAQPLTALPPYGCGVPLAGVCPEAK